MGDGIRGFGGARRAELSPTSQGMPIASCSDTELTFEKAHMSLVTGVSGLITVSKVVQRKTLAVSSTARRLGCRFRDS